MSVTLKLCAVLVWAAFVAYAFAGVHITARMMKEGKRGAPIGMAAFRKDSYTPEGQRLLGVMWRFLMALPIVVVGLVLLSVTLCNIIK